ncbi:2-oxoadipate dioxygenase/decarboxylase HglS [Pseudomonas arsenicoxydans]|uniref:2-oxoadipate dioxygenase/decarboxylase n=1 Tax=Pseudomonas arsenicoxydans TaxID=702115 RepID=A0A502I177_9PSED|nr:VOC family protein [Pseudomonas arsenicoxydans]TPG80737.1 VOC family protein [Pseudomonas arsenicoxydans]
MNTPGFVSPDEIRTRFSRAMSDMYKDEVPLYGTLMELVSQTNQQVLTSNKTVADYLNRTGEIERLDMERHGAIRVGTPEELATIARLFAVMGMQPVGYYDLTTAGVPVHSTAFRAVHEKSLQASPFRVFTSLLRLDLIDNQELRHLVQTILKKRQIFTPKALKLIEKFEANGALDSEDAEDFIQQALETFRWHREATVTAEEYKRLHDQHRLIADVVAFKGPHINHLTPRTLDIDQIQLGMPDKGITPKAVIEGPPRRECPILLRQTSFKALQETVAFTDQNNNACGSHTARFGEIEQRGAALTPKGRALYDTLLNAARDELGEFPNEANAERYSALLEQHFKEFPDNYADLRKQGLVYFRYFPSPLGIASRSNAYRPNSREELIAQGHIQYEPLVYEDFLPVSAAGIFQSNLGDESQNHYAGSSNQEEFEKDLGCKVINELTLYADTQRRSLLECSTILVVPPLV